MYKGTWSIYIYIYIWIMTSFDGKWKLWMILRASFSGSKWACRIQYIYVPIPRIQERNKVMHIYESIFINFMLEWMMAVRTKLRSSILTTRKGNEKSIMAMIVQLFILSVTWKHFRIIGCNACRTIPSFGRIILDENHIKPQYNSMVVSFDDKWMVTLVLMLDVYIYINIYIYIYILVPHRYHRMM
jgi:hypothetical protein